MDGIKVKLGGYGRDMLQLVDSGIDTWLLVLETLPCAFGFEEFPRVRSQDGGLALSAFSTVRLGSGCFCRMKALASTESFVEALSWVVEREDECFKLGWEVDWGKEEVEAG